MTYIGHEQAWAAWREGLGGQRMHHAWLLAGRRGVGKSAFATAAARELLAEPGVPQPGGEHPDILHLSHPPKDDKEARKRDEGKPYELARSIRVDQIRALQRRLTTRPSIGARRAIIIDPADDLETSAANALLKSLEEPPSGTYFLLIAHRPGRLLATIRSRCRMLRFPEVSPGDMAAVLARSVPQAGADLRQAAIMVAGGSPGMAIDFLRRDLGQAWRIMEEIALAGDPDLRLRGALAEALGPRPDRQQQQVAIELACAVAAQRMPGVGHHQIPALADAHAQLVQLAAEAPTFNYDSGLLVMEIGTLLASIAAPRNGADG